MLRNQIADLVMSAARALAVSGELPDLSGVPVEIADTKSAEHGDYACNIALMASKQAGLPPRAIAEKLKAELDKSDVFQAVDVAGPGFLNLRLKPEAISAYVATILGAGPGLARTPNPTPKRINVEFVSVNPNGPITVGSGRGAAYGSALCAVLEAAGNTVHREYYINDGVNSEQMRLFAESVRAILLGKPLPEGGYKGDYVAAVAKELRGHLERGDLAATVEGFRLGRSAYKVDSPYQKAFTDHVAELLADAARTAKQAPSLENAIQEFSAEQLQRLCELQMVRAQSLALKDFGVEFDAWANEQMLIDAGVVDACVDELVTKGVADDGAFRIKFEMEKGGVIKDVIREEQPVEEADDINAVGGTSTEGSCKTLWLRSTKFGDDMDRVLRRKDGRNTYIASDVAYHRDKFNRPVDADKLITILGPDHHGYINRLEAVVAADRMRPATDQAASAPLSEIEAKIYTSPAERDACKAALAEARERLEVLIFQLVRFTKDGKPAPMRKRDGNIYALSDLIAEIGQNVTREPEKQIGAGRDVARFFYLMRSHDTALDFDLDLAEKQSDENPVFYVQYAHARICSVLRKAEGVEALGRWGVGDGDSAVPQSLNAPMLTHPKELALIKKILDLPNEVQRCAQDYGVHRLTTYAMELSRTYHHFYDACRVIQPEQPELSQARLALCQAARIALKATLDLLGVSAPERMEREAQELTAAESSS